VDRVKLRRAVGWPALLVLVLVLGVGCAGRDHAGHHEHQFKDAERWARAFEGIEGQPLSTGDWYVASHAFAPLAFSQSIEGFSWSISSAIASTPGGSGGSGFSGGFSGGGVGGGGVGSW
jgi:hypothetical protein